jgi:hypothetical protein
MTHESVTRIAIGTRSKIVQLFKLDRRGKVQAVFSVQLEKTVPAGLAFARNDVKDIFVFGLFDGQMSV